LLRIEHSKEEKNENLTSMRNEGVYPFPVKSNKIMKTSQIENI